MNKAVTFAIVTGFVAAMASCKQIKNPEALAEREEWIASFSDSIKEYQAKIEITNSQLDECNKEIAAYLDNFEYVKNPRQVTGYYILKGWNSRLPFTSTAIYARISDDEKAELIATLAGGVFNNISVSGGSGEVFSGIVPHDQALNYRHASYNTVCFSGEKADSIMQYIALNDGASIKVNFYNGSDKKSSFVIPEDEKSMIASTFLLLREQQAQKTLQKDLWILSRKIDTARRMLDRADSISSNH